MILRLPALTAAQVALGNSPEIGAESRLFASYDPVDFVGSLVEDSSDPSGAVLTVDAGLSLAATDNLHLRAKNGLEGLSGSTFSVTLDVTYDDDTVGTAVATFELPSNGTGQNYLPAGLTTDFVPADGLRTVKTVTGLNAYAGGAKDGNEFEVVRTRDEDNFVFIGCSTEKVGVPNVQTPISIGCAYNGQAYTKKGVSEQQDLRISTKYKGVFQDLAAFLGHKVTIKVEVHKEDSIFWEKLVYTGFWVTGGPERGEGNDEVIFTSEGPYESFLAGYHREA